ncbi:hypothetical protein [Candidatus Poriferisodalis sp.]|uniref:hypothetical protein n=1 Tax=Candidatus Poriferisodalis sp. TaxID=3101277 RepID=UPI003C6F7AC3
MSAGDTVAPDVDDLDFGVDAQVGERSCGDPKWLCHGHNARGPGRHCADHRSGDAVALVLGGGHRTARRYSAHVAPRDGVRDDPDGAVNRAAAIAAVAQFRNGSGHHPPTLTTLAA